MDYIKDFFKRGLLGILLGVFINQFTFLILAFQGEVVSISSEIIITQFIISGLAGFYFSGVSVIFDVEEWSLLKQTVTHSIVMLPYFPISYYAGWMPKHVVGRIGFIITYIIIYLIIWFSFKIYWERKAKELNNQIQKRNKVSQH